ISGFGILAPPASPSQLGEIA
ncbi:MAG: hypothetical protein EZS28_043879, partial [Streblomastix strix]